MKLTTFLAAIAIAALGTTATADRLSRDNVACLTGSVYGFTVQGATGMTHYVQDADLVRCTNADGVPASVDIFEPAEVVTWLASIGIEITDLQLRRDQTERKIVDGNLVLTKSRTVNGGW